MQPGRGDAVWPALMAARGAAGVVLPWSVWIALWVLAGLLLSLFVAPAAFAQGRQPNYRLDIQAPAELLVPLRTNTLLGRWRSESDFEPVQLDLFIERMREEALLIAQAAGYFSAQVTVSRSSADALPIVTVIVDAGARTTVNLLRLTLLGPADEEPGLRERLFAGWPLAEGSFFETASWERGKRSIIEALQQRGYLRARIAQSRADVDPELTAASLSLQIDSGPRFRFGPVNIQGDSRYPKSIVEALMPWEQGELYAFDTLQTLQSRLRLDGHYSSATILPDLQAVEQDPERLDVPIDIRLRERKSQRTTFGLGYSTDKGVRGLAGYDKLDMFGRGWIADTGVQAESVQHVAFANLRTPADHGGHYYRGGLRSERLDVQGELTDTNTAYLGRGIRRENLERFLALQYQTERRVIDSDTGNLTGHSTALSLSHSWMLRRVDSAIDPRDGYTLNAQITGGLTGAAYDRSFVRLYARAMHFLSMPKGSSLDGGLLVTRLESGWVTGDSISDIPSENLFRTGGSTTVRGYSYLGLGVASGNAVTGGRALGVASVEYQHPIRPGWAGAVFVDAGNASASWSEFKPAYGAGFGARWRSPVGPVNVDIAYGEEDRRWRLHLSVGYTF